MTFRPWALLLVCIGVVAACSSGKPAHVVTPSVTTVETTSTLGALPTTTTLRSVTSPSTTRGPAVSVTASPRTTTSSVVTLSESDNGKTIDVAKGGTVTLVLHSTYWQIDGSSNSAVLAADGQPTTSGQPPGSGCVPGGGCGTVTARYTALADGSATLTAHRSTCGEAMACTPDQSSYKVTIMVTGC